MTEVTAGAAKAKRTKPAPSPTGSPTHRTTKSDLPNMGTPQPLREMAGKGVAAAKTIDEKAKVAEQATDLHKNTYTIAAQGAAAYKLKVFEIARTNASSAFDYAHELLGVKSVPEFIALSTAHARKRFEAMTEQTKELAELAVKAAAEIAEPLKAGERDAHAPVWTKTQASRDNRH
jgi:phasin